MADVGAYGDDELANEVMDRKPIGGWVTKKGGVKSGKDSKKWQRRWLELHFAPIGLAYYTKPGGNMKGNIDVEEWIVVRESEAHDARPNEVEVVLNDVHGESRPI